MGGARELNAPRTVVGAKKRDTIVVDRQGDTLTVQLNRSQPTAFRAAAVLGIRVNADRGNDVVRISEAVGVGVTVDGGLGNDAITGGGGDDQLAGDVGELAAVVRRRPRNQGFCSESLTRGRRSDEHIAV